MWSEGVGAAVVPVTNQQRWQDWKRSRVESVSLYRGEHVGCVSSVPAGLEGSASWGAGCVRWLNLAACLDEFFFGPSGY